MMDRKTNTQTSTLLRKTLIATAVLAALGSAACSKKLPGQMSDTQASSAPKESNTLGAAIDDTGITAKVKSRLSTDARTKDATINVETNNGVVSLKGSVAKSDQKDAAEELARTVEGVKGVDDQLTSPSAMSSMEKKADSVADSADKKLDQAGDTINDSWITTKVKADLAADSQIKDAQLSVSTSNGVVMLSGTAPSKAVASRAETVAKQVNGVKKVDDSAVTIGK